MERPILGSQTLHAWTYEAFLQRGDMRRRGVKVP